MESVRYYYGKLDIHHCIVDTDPSSDIGARLDDSAARDTVQGGLAHV